MPDAVKELLGLLFKIAGLIVHEKYDEAEENARRILVKLEARKAWHRDG